LVAAGFLIVGDDEKHNLAFRATPKATRLRRSVKPKSRGDVLSLLGQAVGAAPYPEPEEAEDRSLGPLAGLDPEDLDTAVREHGEWVDRWSKPLFVAARVVSWWLNRKS
jgi:hypothetical protein